MEAKVGGTPQSGLLFVELKNLLLEISQMDIAVFELEYRDFRILIRKNGRSQSLVDSNPPRGPSSGATRLDNASHGGTRLEPDASPYIKTIQSPLNGIFYLSPSPTDKPFVQEGDVIEENHVVGLVEAMKVFNEIMAEWSGRVARILVRNGELVRVGQVLMELVPS